MKKVISSFIWGQQRLVPIKNFLGFGSAVRGDKKPLLAVYRDESNLKNAMLTIRMALNPGEELNAAVAARIRREATAYDEFLQNPRRVGWIVLYVKEFKGPGSHCVSREQLRIREPLEGFADPEEGRAFFTYDFARSRDKVLEFMVHDEHDKPLFALVRTYTNWTVYKELDLGLNRKFYLTLAEGAAGYVNLRAGFSPVSVKDSVTDFVSVRQRPAAACANAGGGNLLSLSEGSSCSLSVRQPANALAFGMLMLIMSLCSVMAVLDLSTSKTQTKRPAKSNPAGNVLADVSGENTLLTPPPNASDYHADVVYSSANLKPISFQKKETVMRLADIRRFNVSVDRKSCDGKCLKLLDGIQRRLQSRLNRLNLPPAAPELVDVSKPSASLVVSYQALNDEKGNIHLTLSDHEGSLWNADLEHSVNADARISDAQITNQYSEQLSTEVLLTIFRAKDQCLSETDRTSTTKEQTK